MPAVKTLAARLFNEANRGLLLDLLMGRLEFAGRLFFLCFIALLVYFPPRMFFQAEDVNRRSTWLTMLPANAPVIFRLLIGTNKADWN